MMWLPRSLTMPGFLSLKGAAAPAIWQSQSRDLCFNLFVTSLLGVLAGRTRAPERLNAVPI